MEQTVLSVVLRLPSCECAWACSWSDRIHHFTECVRRPDRYTYSVKHSAVSVTGETTTSDYYELCTIYRVCAHLSSISFHFVHCIRMCLLFIYLLIDFSIDLDEKLFVQMQCGVERKRLILAWCVKNQDKTVFFCCCFLTTGNYDFDHGRPFCPKIALANVNEDEIERPCHHWQCRPLFLFFFNAQNSIR